MTSRRILLLWLALALVAAQSLAFLHRVVHAPQAASSSIRSLAIADLANAAKVSAAVGSNASNAISGGSTSSGGSAGSGGTASRAGSASPSWAASLFAGHDDGSACRLYDALGHDAAPLHVAVVLALAIPAFFLAQQQGDCLLRFAALFDARGPPSIR